MTKVLPLSNPPYLSLCPVVQLTFTKGAKEADVSIQRQVVHLVRAHNQGLHGNTDAKIRQNAEERVQPLCLRQTQNVFNQPKAVADRF